MPLELIHLMLGGVEVAAGLEGLEDPSTEATADLTSDSTAETSAFTSLTNTSAPFFNSLATNTHPATPEARPTTAHNSNSIRYPVIM